MRNRQEEIKKKGFKMPFENGEDKYSAPLDFSSIKTGAKTLEDAIITNIGDYHQIDHQLGDKEFVLRAIHDNNLVTLRQISNYYYNISGIYSRLCRYMAFLYRYDWVVTPYINSGGGFGKDLSLDAKVSDSQKSSVLTDFFKALNYLDNFCPKQILGDIALKVIKEGVYYGYIMGMGTDSLDIQELPAAYCRSYYSSNRLPAVEFQMSFFDKKFSTEKERKAVLNLFGDDFKKGYKLYQDGKLKGNNPKDGTGWYLLDPQCTVKFNINNSDTPPFISTIPAIIDLDRAQGLDRKKMAQQLIKILVQKMPVDKNGDLVFDVDEARELHNNAVQMLSKTVGIDVLTTFADVDVADTSDNSSNAATDTLERIERAVYNEAGVSQLQFNSSGNIALQYSILNDEALMKDLVLQFQVFLNRILKPFNKHKKQCYYKAEILQTTIYNYKEMAKLYKEQTQLGYSKMLPQIAMGQSQSSILATAYFENGLLDLMKVFIPPMSSNTMNAAVLAGFGGDAASETTGSSSTSASTTSEGGGRPEKDDTEKSEKTMQNIESQS